MTAIAAYEQDALKCMYFTVYPLSFETEQPQQLNVPRLQAYLIGYFRVCAISVVLLRQGELILRLQRRTGNVTGPHIVALGVHTVNGVSYWLALHLNAV